jgi:cleavage and polyadenylation specificity factor subunit 3
LHHHHADQEENYEMEPSSHPDTPSHLDRLIAFLHSHFGTVEFLSPEDVNSETGKSDKNLNGLQEDEEEIKPETAVSSGTMPDGQDDARPKTNGHNTSAEPAPTNQPELSGPVLRIRLDDHVADVVLQDMTVNCEHDNLKRRVESVLQVASRTITPLAPIHPKSSWVAKGGSKRIAIKPET